MSENEEGKSADERLYELGRKKKRRVLYLDFLLIFESDLSKVIQ